VFNFEQTNVLWLLKVFVNRASCPFGQPAKASLQRSKGEVVMESPTVLCIDDCPQALELRKANLESHGYCVKIASSGSTAMKMLEEESVAAVLLEYKLEGLDTEAVACHIRQRFPNLPIILLSAYSEMPERILWFLDESVMKSELPRLAWLIEGATRQYRLALRSKELCRVWNCWTGALAHLGVAWANALQSRTSQGAWLIEGATHQYRLALRSKEVCCVWNCWTGALAHLGVARANASQSRTSQGS
jgi:CheY-like chemotaxis protein